MRSKGLTPEQLKAAEALASGISQAKAAEVAGVTRITVTRWMKLPHFAQKVAELKRKKESAESEVFVEIAKTKVRQGAVSRDELISILSGIVRDEDARVGDRLKSAQILGKWMGLEEPKRFENLPELPTAPLSNSELCKRSDVVKTQVLVGAQFLVKQAMRTAVEGNLQEASAALVRSLELATNSIPDLAKAANTVEKAEFVILPRSEYFNLLPDHKKSDPYALLPLTYERLFGWSYQRKRYKTP